MLHLCVFYCVLHTLHFSRYVLSMSVCVFDVCVCVVEWMMRVVLIETLCASVRLHEFGGGWCISVVDAPG